MSFRFRIAAFLLFAVFPVAVSARAHVFVLSGGGAPWSNHYSQYLQTKTLATGLGRIFGQVAVDVRFGIGNNAEDPKVFPDVHAKITEEDVQNERMIYGVLSANAAATKENVRDYFENILPSKLTKDDAFFLFVSDHGMPNSRARAYENNCIHLWSYDPESAREGGFDDQCLSKDELLALITKNVPAKKTVFAMSQCYSGGFHRLSVDPDGDYPSANASLCGFTSVTEDLVASGCTDDVEADRYQGYERYFTEMITGRDVVTGKNIPEGRKLTVRSAHRAAALKDMTVDVPQSTSDYYLLAWHDAIFSDGFKPRAGSLRSSEVKKLAEAVASFALDRPTILEKSAELRDLAAERLADLDGMVAALSRYNPGAAVLFKTGSVTDLEDRMAEIAAELDAIDEKEGPLFKRMDKIRYKVLFKNWRQAVLANEVSALSALERDEFEIKILAPLEKSLGAGANAESGLQANMIAALAQYEQKDPSRAKMFSSYWRRRPELIAAWAKGSQDEKILAAAVEFEKTSNEIASHDARYEALLREESHVRRILQARRALAALIAIAEMEDRKAAEELLGLDECEKSRF